MSFEKIFLCRGFTNSPIDIHDFSLELSHLFRITSLDSRLTQNQKISLKIEKDVNRSKNDYVLFLKK